MVPRWVKVTVAVFAFGACTDIVYRDRPPFNPPPDAASGFLGYFDVSTKQTSCGNCHVGHQRDWKTTEHASAWADLQASGDAQPSCNGCHTLSGKGNAKTGNVGYSATPDIAYHDVQCESCHGPGLTHAEVPDVGAKPVASIAVHTADSLGTCGECHSGTHTPFAEEWEQSRHAEAQPAAVSNYVANPATSTCISCHEGRGVLKAWGVTAEYLEKPDPINATTAMGITCAVCHNPHGSPNTKQLRYPIDTPDPSRNLCMKCHLNRTVPASGSSRGNTPHAPQGAVLMGEAGYVNPAYVDTVLLNASSAATHFSPTSNPRLCAGCHLFAFPTTDTAGTFNQATGHLFRPIPCYGPNGLPTDSIQNCAFSAAARSFRACAASGCHSTQNQAALVYSVQRGRLQSLTRDLWVDLDGDRTIDAYPVDSGMLPRIKLNSTDLNPTAAPITAADGAEFNVRTFGEDSLGVFMYANGDKSRGAHNPFYEEALLRASINELTALYGAQPWWTPPSPAVQRILDGPLGASGRVPFPQPTGRRTASR